MEVKDSIPDEHLQDNTQSEKIVIKRKRNIAIFIVVSLLNVGLLALLWTQLLTPAQNQGSTSSDGPNVANPLKGRPAPGFRLAALGTGQGSTLDMASLKGKAVVLNFWSSSCVPCQDEAHLLQSTWQHMQSKGVVFVGVDFEDTQGDGLSFLQKYGITYLNVLDADGSTAVHYGVVYTPTTFFINSQGVVVHTISREMTQQELQQNLQSL